jgi:hypothetical protein
MKSLILASLVAALTTTVFASTSTKSSAAKMASDNNEKALTLKEIAQRAQSTASLLEQNNSKTNIILSVDNTGRTTDKVELAKVSSEDAKTTTKK